MVRRRFFVGWSLWLALWGLMLWSLSANAQTTAVEATDPARPAVSITLTATLVGEPGLPSSAAAALGSTNRVSGTPDGVNTATKTFFAQATASHTITFTIIGLPPDPPVLEQRDGGHWLLTLADEGTWCAPQRVGCWSAEWVPDEPAVEPDEASPSTEPES